MLRGHLNEDVVGQKKYGDFTAFRRDMRVRDRFIHNNRSVCVDAASQLDFVYTAPGVFCNTPRSDVWCDNHA